jgi:hypothetical protein
MKFFLNLSVLLGLFGVSLSSAQPTPTGPNPNEVSILFYNPPAIPLKAVQQKTPFFAVISYALDFAEDATIHLELNATSPEAFESIAQADVTRGRGSVTLTGWRVAQNWGEPHPLTLRARLVPKSSAGATTLVSKARTIIFGDVTDRPTDGVIILGVEPERLALGAEQEVAVLVSYDLKSVDRANLYLGFNTRTSTSYVIFSEKEISKGKGEVVLTARVTPKYWGEKVFFQAFVNMSEADHAGDWSPIARDSEPIELTAPVTEKIGKDR